MMPDCQSQMAGIVLTILYFVCVEKKRTHTFLNVVSLRQFLAHSSAISSCTSIVCSCCLLDVKILIVTTVNKTCQVTTVQLLFCGSTMVAVASKH